MRPSSNKSTGNLATVYIPQNVGDKNLHAATQYGIFTTFTRHELPTDPEGVEEWVSEVKKWVSTYNPDHDYFLLIGDPLLISVVSALTATMFTYYNALKWDRQTRSYIVVKVNLGEEDEV